MDNSNQSETQFILNRIYEKYFSTSFNFTLVSGTQQSQEKINEYQSFSFSGTISREVLGINLTIEEIEKVLVKNANQ